MSESLPTADHRTLTTEAAFPMDPDTLVENILNATDHALDQLMRLKADAGPDWRAQISRLDEAEIHLRKAHQRVELARVVARGKALFRKRSR